MTCSPPALTASSKPPSTQIEGQIGKLINRKTTASCSQTRRRREGKYLVRFNLLLNLGAGLIERQGCEVIVVYTDIKLCREEVLKASGVNPGVRWAGMHMAEQLPYIVMIATIKAQIRKVIQIDFLFADLNAHRHCNVLELVYESLPDILEVMITENEIDSAV